MKINQLLLLLLVHLPVLVSSELLDRHRFNNESTLIRILLNEQNYLKKVRPSSQVIVDIRFVFNQIVSMVEKEQIIVTNCFVDQKWTGTPTAREWNEISSKSY